MSYLVALLGLILGLVAGERFPDIDQRTDLLLHRSILTHGFLFPLVLYLLASKTQWKMFRWFVVGVVQGVAVHLAFDLFPRAWIGYALVGVPFFGWLPVLLSWAWLAASGVVCLYLAGRLVRNCLETSLFVLGVMVAFVYGSWGENALWRPMTAVAFSVIIASIVLVLTPNSSD